MKIKRGDIPPTAPLYCMSNQVLALKWGNTDGVTRVFRNEYIEFVD